MSSPETDASVIDELEQAIDARRYEAARQSARRLEACTFTMPSQNYRKTIALAWLALHDGNTAQAQQWASQAAQHAARLRRPSAWTFRADLLGRIAQLETRPLEAGFLERCETWFRDARLPEDLGAYFLQCWCRLGLATGQFRQVVRRLEQLAAQGSTGLAPDVDLQLGWAYLALGQVDRAATVFRRLEPQRNASDVLLAARTEEGSATVAYLQGQYQDALDGLERGRRLLRATLAQPDSAGGLPPRVQQALGDLFVREGIFRLERLHQEQAGRKILRRTLNQEPLSPQLAQVGQSYFDPPAATPIRSCPLSPLDQELQDRLRQLGHGPRTDPQDPTFISHWLNELEHWDRRYSAGEEPDLFCNPLVLLEFLLRALELVIPAFVEEGLAIPAVISRLVDRAEQLARRLQVTDQQAEFLFLRALLRYGEGLVGSDRQAIEEGLRLAVDAGKLILQMRTDLRRFADRRSFGIGPLDRLAAQATLEATWAARLCGKRHTGPGPEGRRLAQAALFDLEQSRGERGLPSSCGRDASGDAVDLLDSSPPPDEGPVKPDRLLREIPSGHLFLTILRQRFRPPVLLWAAGRQQAGASELQQLASLLDQCSELAERRTAASETRPKQDNPEATEELVLPQVAELSTLFQVPARPLARGIWVNGSTIRTIVVLASPDEALEQLPIHALDIGGRLLGDLVTIRYAPSMRSYLNCRRAALHRSHLTNEVRGFEALPMTQAVPGIEAAEPARCLREWPRATVPLYYGHLRYNEQDPAQSRLEGEPKEDSMGHGDASQQSAGSMFQLQCADLAKLRFPRTKLFCLAACQGARDGIGSLLGGTGPTMLLLRAGVPGVLSCQWPVRKDVASDFVNAFCSSLTHSPLSQAFDEACHLVRERYSDPYLWAPFRITGSCEESWLARLLRVVRQARGTRRKIVAECGATAGSGSRR